MRTFSLVTVRSQNGDRVNGNWIQDHVGTLESAATKARSTEAANSNRITVGVVESTGGCVSPGMEIHNKVRLDLVALRVKGM